jgi:hypothetical protein
MPRLRARFEKSGMSLHALGVAMGYPEDSARKSAWQFLQKDGRSPAVVVAPVREGDGSVRARLAVMLC